MQDLDRHELRTAWLARRVALVMGLDAAEAAAIGEAARSHDSGMRFVSPAVWRNPGLLGRPERREIEMHAVLGGAALMSPQPERPDRPRLAVQVALLHHEWWNGNGYPFGLAGRAVPFAARVTAVADVFDALVHARLDRQAWAREDAMAYLLKERGLQFDPLCAEAMHSVASGLPEDWETAAQQECDAAAGDDAGPLHQLRSPVAGLASRMMPA
jgi:putative two-component system response regulator